MLPSETMIWQPEFTDKTLSRKPGAVQGEKINYSAQDSDILTTIGFRPDAASEDDSREKFTPAQNMIFSRKSAQLASRQSV